MTDWVGRWQDMRAVGEADWAGLQPEVAKGALLQYRDGRYWHGEKSIGEEFAFGLVRERRLWRAGPPAAWPLPTLGQPPAFPASGSAQVMQALFSIFDEAGR